MPFPLYYDFFILWAGAKMASSGKDIYNHEEMTLLLNSAHIGWPETSVAWGYTYPPWAIWAYYPLGLFTFYQAAFFWLFITFVILFVIIRLSLKMNKDCSEQWSRLPTIVLITSAICYLPFVKALTFGQGSFILTLGTTAFCYFYTKKQFLTSGIFLSLSLLKPQLLIPLYCCILFHTLVKKQMSLALGITYGFLGQITLSYWLFPDGFFYYVDYVSGILDRAQNLNGSSLSQILYLCFGIEGMALPVLAIGTLFSLGIISRAQALTINEIKYILPICLLSTPYAFLHSYSILWPCYLTVLGRSYAKSKSLPFYLLLVLGLFGILIFKFLWELEPLSYMIPLALLLGTWYLDRQQQ